MTRSPHSSRRGYSTPTTSRHRYYEVATLGVAVEVDTPVLGDLLTPLFPFSRVEALARVDLSFAVVADAIDGWTLYSGRRPIARSTSRGDLFPQVEWAIARTALQSLSTHLALHTAAVARDGRVCLVVGPSGAGKTTLALALCARGWRLLGDDVILIDRRDASLRAFPRSLMVKRPWSAPVALDGLLTRGTLVATSRGEVLYCPPHALGPAYLTTARSVGTVAFVAQGAAQVERMGRAAGVLGLIEQTGSERTSEHDVSLLVRLTETAAFHRITVGDLADAIFTLERVHDRSA